MTTLYGCVFEAAGEVAFGDPIQEFAVTISGTSTQSPAIIGSGRKRRRIRLYPDGDCFVTWAEDPVALNDGTSGRPMGAEQREYFDIEAGHKIAVIERTA